MKSQMLKKKSPWTGLGFGRSMLICPVCSHPRPFVEFQDAVAECQQCGHVLVDNTPKSPYLCMVYSLTGLIFYVAANLLPFMSFESYGRLNEATIWSGVLTLIEDGSWGIAIIVFIASILIPAIKLLALFYLSVTRASSANKPFLTRLFRFVEWIGPWSMLDVFLVAIFIAIIKLGSMGTVSAEPGSLMFLMVVIFTMLAAKNFDVKSIWSRNLRRDHVRPS